MATVKAFLKEGKEKKRNTVTNVRFYVSRGRGKTLLYWTSTLVVDPALWDSKKQQLKNVVMNPLQKIQFNKSVTDLKDVLMIAYTNADKKDELTTETFKLEVDKQLNPAKYIQQPVQNNHSFFDDFDEFLLKHKIGDVRRNNYKVVKRAMQRYEMFKQLKDKNFKLDVNNLNSNHLYEIETFLKIEHKHYVTYPKLYQLIPEVRVPKQRGQNTISGIFSKLKTFNNWNIKQGITSNNPFLNYTIAQCKYGTPYYLTKKERDDIYNYDLSSRPDLETERDIFIFQCFIGCRIGDLFNLKKSNFDGHYVEYIQHKTKEEDPRTIRIPIENTPAKEIIEKYNYLGDDKLLPFTNKNRYNIAIKEFFTIVGITKLVTIINPTSREEEQTPINVKASSHLARRTFVGNLFKMVKDQKMVSELSGHAPNSRAFSRYANVDDDMKKDMMKLLM